ncbi:hypothetical protein OAS86_07005 [Gammaproteobacteria bacterium]|nr:hypothetical protein [Gammaproteobacteria bacterium]
MIVALPIANADVKIASQSLLVADRSPDATLEIQVDSLADGVKALVINDGADAKDLLVVEANGEVGIGTSTPAYSLDVNGTARITATPSITTATNMLVKNPSSGQISEQLIEPVSRQYAMTVADLSSALVDSELILGNLDFRHNANGSGDNLAIRSTAARTVQYTGYEIYPNAPGNGFYRSITLNLAAGTWTELSAGTLGVNEALRYTIFDANGDYYVIELRHNNSKIFTFAHYLPNA